MAKRRGWLRLLAELQALGIGGDWKTLLKVVRKTAAVDFERDREAAHYSLTATAAFAKAGREEFLGLAPRLPSLPQGVPAQVSSRPLQGFATRNGLAVRG